ncbi:MAG: hypothetical protein B6241_00715 [Spirochaetaceae bacterium 4572_59]|nr:MAG: hypothetical protein B6241_00715 [Spirochaetaceae bacterium 4572_59]
MNLSEVVKKECCFRLNENKKTEVLIEMMECIHQKGFIEDLENLKKEIFYREQLMSTGVGMGIGIPHVRFKGVEKPLIAIGIKEKGVVDYDSIDNEDIKIIVMIMVGENQHKEHIRLLSQVIGRMKDAGDREKLIHASDSEEIYNLLTGSASDD